MWLLRSLFPQLRNVPDNPLEAMARTLGGAAVLMVVSIVAGGVREEVQRAFLLHRFRTDLGGPMTGLILTSVGFGLGHVVQGWDAMIVTGLLGRLLGPRLPVARQHHRRRRQPRPRQRGAGGGLVPAAGAVTPGAYGAITVTGVRRRRSISQSAIRS